MSKLLRKHPHPCALSGGSGVLDPWLQENTLQWHLVWKPCDTRLGTPAWQVRPGGSQPSHSGVLEPHGSLELPGAGCTPTWTHLVLLPKGAAPSRVISLTSQPGRLRYASIKAQKAQRESSVRWQGKSAGGSPSSYLPKEITEAGSPGTSVLRKTLLPSGRSWGCVNVPQLSFNPLSKIPDSLKTCELTATERQPNRSRLSRRRWGSGTAAQKQVLADSGIRDGT